VFLLTKKQNGDDPIAIDLSLHNTTLLLLLLPLRSNGDLTLPAFNRRNGPILITTTTAAGTTTPPRHDLYSLPPPCSTITSIKTATSGQHERRIDN